MKENNPSNLIEILAFFKEDIPFNLPKEMRVYSIKKTKDSLNIVEKEMEKIFEELKAKFPKNLYNIIFYLLGELADNIDQHSNFSCASIMADYDKNKKEINICIFDDGITIPGAFEAKSILTKDDIDAIKQALEGKSTKKEEGRGTGLRSSKNLVEKGLNGDFYIISRKGFVHENTSKIIDRKLNGTLIYIKFKDPQEDLNIYSYIE